MERKHQQPVEVSMELRPAPPARRPPSRLAAVAAIAALGIVAAGAAAWLAGRGGEADLDARTRKRLAPLAPSTPTAASIRID